MSNQPLIDSIHARITTAIENATPRATRDATWTKVTRTSDVTVNATRDKTRVTVRRITWDTTYNATRDATKDDIRWMLDE